MPKTSAKTSFLCMLLLLLKLSTFKIKEKKYSACNLRYISGLFVQIPQQQRGALVPSIGFRYCRVQSWRRFILGFPITPAGLKNESLNILIWNVREKRTFESNAGKCTYREPLQWYSLLRLLVFWTKQKHLWSNASVIIDDIFVLLISSKIILISMQGSNSVSFKLYIELLQ